MYPLNILSFNQRRHDNSIVDSRRFEECHYYLKSYGTAGAMVGFLSRYQRWKDACYHIRENVRRIRILVHLSLSLFQHCSTDIFVDHLWLPALKTGQLEHLEMCLLEIDPSLNVWEHYLTAVCRLLSQRKLFYILYHTQIFMKVGVIITSGCGLDVAICVDIVVARCNFNSLFAGLYPSCYDMYQILYWILWKSYHNQRSLSSSEIHFNSAGTFSVCYRISTVSTKWGWSQNIWRSTTTGGFHSQFVSQYEYTGSSGMMS